MKVQQLPMGTQKSTAKGQQRFEQVFHRQFRHCDCAMPMISKKWNDALGTFVALRLCCLARAVEKLTGERLYEVYDFAPRWAWDCKKMEQRTALDGSVEIVEKGPPPEWMTKRFREKGITVENVPNEQ